MSTGRIQEDRNILRARGKRLKMIRTMLFPDRADFSELVNKKDKTTKFWEGGSGNGFTGKAAGIPLQKLRELGVYASYEWLVDGIGEPPTKISLPRGITIDKLSPHDRAAALKNAFRACYPQTCLFYTCKDDTLESHFSLNDMLGGPSVPLDEISSLDNKFCLLQEATLRQVGLLSTTNNEMTLTTNMITNEKRTIEPGRIEMIAPVSFHIKISEL